MTAEVPSELPFQPPAPARPGEQQPATCSCASETLATPAGTILVLRVGGEVDLASMPVLDSALDEHLERRPRHLVVDLAELTFCSVRGLGTLVQAADTATAAGIAYAVSAVPPWLDRVWALCWDSGRIPTHYADVATAVTAARARDAR